MSELATTHSEEEIAESLYRALSRAAYHAEGVSGEPPDWAGLSLDEQQGFLHLAREAPAVLGQLEGSPLREVGHRLYAEAGPGRLSGDDWDRLGEEQKLMWEMAARQCAIVQDCDEAPSLGHAEGVVLEWFRRRLPRIIT